MSTKPYISIAIISDLHCQKYVDGSLRTKLHTKLLDNPPNKHPVQALKSIIRSESKKVDYFFVLGDVANKADQEGFVFGVKLINELYDILGADKLIYTIGNHDIDRLKKNNADPLFMLRNTNNYPFRFKDPSLIADLNKKFWSDDFCIIEDEYSLIFTLNTSKLTNAKGLSSIDDSIISKIDAELSLCKSVKKIKIALCHHHPIQHSDLDDFFTSQDLIDRGDRLMRILQKNNFDLFIHGHKHNARLKYDSDIPVFCSGSFSSLENTEYFSVPNMAHFIEIYKNKSDGNFRGIIETWAYNITDGWKKSKDPNIYFPTYTGFGLNIDLKDIVKKIYLQFKSKIDDYKDVSFNEIQTYFPDMVFFSPNQQELFSNLLLDDYSITILQDNHTGEKAIKKQLI